MLKLITKLHIDEDFNKALLERVEDITTAKLARDNALNLRDESKGAADLNARIDYQKSIRVMNSEIATQEEDLLSFVRATVERAYHMGQHQLDHKEPSNG